MVSHNTILAISFLLAISCTCTLHVSARDLQVLENGENGQDGSLLELDRWTPERGLVKREAEETPVTTPVSATTTDNKPKEKGGFFAGCKRRLKRIKDLITSPFKKIFGKGKKGDKDNGTRSSGSPLENNPTFSLLTNIIDFYEQSGIFTKKVEKQLKDDTMEMFDDIRVDVKKVTDAVVKISDILVDEMEASRKPNQVPDAKKIETQVNKILKETLKYLKKKKKDYE